MFYGTGLPFLPLVQKSNWRETVFEPLFITVLPALFLIVLYRGKLAFRHRKIDMDGAAPISKELFRWSKYAIPIPWAGMIFQSFGLNLSLIKGPLSLKWISPGLWTAGFALLFVGRLGLGSSFRVGCAKESTILRVSGLFRYSRNPMYLGIYLTHFASALYTMNPLVFFVGIFVAAVHHRIVLGEEACLRKTFGEEYVDYCRRVRRYL